MKVIPWFFKRVTFGVKLLTPAFGILKHIYTECHRGTCRKPLGLCATPTGAVVAGQRLIRPIQATSGNKLFFFYKLARITISCAVVLICFIEGFRLLLKEKSWWLHTHQDMVVVQHGP